jgi:putative transposase
LVNDYDLIVHEDLKITNMVRRPKPRPGEDGAYEPTGHRPRPVLTGPFLTRGGVSCCR